MDIAIMFLLVIVASMFLAFNITSEKNEEIDRIQNSFEQSDEYVCELLEEAERREEHIKILTEAVNTVYEEDRKQLLNF